MRKLLLFFLFATLSTSAFSQSKLANSWSLEPFVSFGIEEELALFGLEYGSQLNYSIYDRFGASFSLGSFQSITKWDNWRVQNASEMLVSLNLFVDVLKIKEKNRLRLSAGATYFRGDVAHANQYIDILEDDIPVSKPVSYDVLLYNNIGMNIKLSYLYQFSDKWYMGINLHGYEIFDGIDDGLFIKTLSFGGSVGYNF